MGRLLHGCGLLNKTDFRYLPTLLCFQSADAFVWVLLVLDICGSEQVYLSVVQRDALPAFFSVGGVVPLDWSTDNTILSADVVNVLRLLVDVKVSEAKYPVSTGGALRAHGV